MKLKQVNRSYYCKKLSHHFAAKTRKIRQTILNHNSIICQNELRRHWNLPPWSSPQVPVDSQSITSSMVDYDFNSKNK